MIMEYIITTYIVLLRCGVHRFSKFSNYISTYTRVLQNVFMSYSICVYLLLCLLLLVHGDGLGDQHP